MKCLNCKQTLTHNSFIKDGYEKHQFICENCGFAGDISSTEKGAIQSFRKVVEAEKKRGYSLFEDKKL